MLYKKPQPSSLQMKNGSVFVHAETSPCVVLPVHERRDSLVGVVRAAGEYRLIALRSIASGERMFRIEGELSPRPSRFSVQIGEGLHIDLGPGHTSEEILDRYFWRFMNHSCEPNSIIRGQEVIALRTIPPWQDVTFDYNATEYDMADPFVCRCGSPQCLGVIRGFKHLAAAQRHRLRPHLAGHLIAHLDSPPLPAVSLMTA